MWWYSTHPLELCGSNYLEEGVEERGGMVEVKGEGNVFSLFLAVRYTTDYYQIQ